MSYKYIVNCFPIASFGRRFEPGLAAALVFGLIESSRAVSESDGGGVSARG